MRVETKRKSEWTTLPNWSGHEMALQAVFVAPRESTNLNLLFCDIFVWAKLHGNAPTLQNSRMVIFYDDSKISCGGKKAWRNTPHVQNLVYELQMTDEWALVLERDAAIPSPNQRYQKTS
jgi:hypothetical protein